MKTFDDLEVRRPELARSYLELLKAQPGRPIALFAPRRAGKTFFTGPRFDACRTGVGLHACVRRYMAAPDLSLERHQSRA
jgi:hypothetical protein